VKTPQSTSGNIKRKAIAYAKGALVVGLVAGFFAGQSWYVDQGRAQEQRRLVENSCMPVTGDANKVVCQPGNVVFTRSAPVL
jgi:hypothetical protein